VVVAWLPRSLHLKPTFWELFARHQWTVKRKNARTANHPIHCTFKYI